MENAVNDRPPMPDLPPAPATVLGLAAAVLLAVTQVDSEYVQIAAILGATILGVAVAAWDRGVRVARNETEQQRIAVSHHPDVIITDDPESAFDGD